MQSLANEEVIELNEALAFSLTWQKQHLLYQQLSLFLHPCESSVTLLNRMWWRDVEPTLGVAAT